MTERVQGWAKVEQARSDAALQLDTDAGLTFTRVAASRRSTCWLRAERGDARHKVGQPTSKA
jgi:hypothetical protein